MRHNKMTEGSNIQHASYGSGIHYSCLGTLRAGDRLEGRPLGRSVKGQEEHRMQRAEDMKGARVSTLP